MEYRHIITDNLPTVAIIGRVNVGKSTLFNRLIEQKKALVSDIPGTTRTSNIDLVLWRGVYFRLIDTGGLTFEDDVPLEDDIMKQSEKAMKLADVILFVADGQTGVMPQEKELSKRMRRIVTKPVILIANKIDKQKDENELAEGGWQSLGLGLPFPVSAASGRNVGDLLDHIFARLTESGNNPMWLAERKSITPLPLGEGAGGEGIGTPKTESPTIRVSIIGKPNVGKSSLFNKLIGEDRVIVSDMPHTTREPHDTDVLYAYTSSIPNTERKSISSLPPITQRITFVDTAGIRRKAKVAGELERAGISKSLTSIIDSDIILFVIDGSEAISHQDKQLASLTERRAKSVILLVNKWDLTADNSQTHRSEVAEKIHVEFPHLDFAPVVFVSGKSGYRVHDIFPLIMHAWQARHIEIGDKVMEAFLKGVIRTHAPARGKGTRHPEILGMRQLGSNPPVFEILIKFRTSLHRSYLNFLENKLREQFDLFATPVIIKMSKMKR